MVIRSFLRISGSGNFNLVQAYRLNYDCQDTQIKTGIAAGKLTSEFTLSCYLHVTWNLIGKQEIILAANFDYSLPGPSDN